MSHGGRPCRLRWGELRCRRRVDGGGALGGARAPDRVNGLSLDPPSAVISASPAVRPLFAHESEAELARILDFYAVRWEYEPHTFPILWNLEGDVLESFSPDFYLPDLDLYVELTTLRQRLVRKKNRKLRRLRELYPGIRIKLFYARDFRALMLKYGKLGLADALSGAPGQVVPGRVREQAASPTQGAARATGAVAKGGGAPAAGTAATGAAADVGAAVAVPVAEDGHRAGAPGATPHRSRHERRRRRIAATAGSAAPPTSSGQPRVSPGPIGSPEPMRKR